MYLSKSTKNFSIKDHIQKKKKELEESQDLLNEAYARALSRGKSSVSKSQEAFSNNYLKKKDLILQNPAFIINTSKKQEGKSTETDNFSQETKSQFTDKGM